MKVMVLLSRFPYPLEKGDKLRAFHQIKELSIYHEVVLCCLTDKKVPKESLNALRPYCEEIEVIHLPKWRIGIRLIQAIFDDKPFQVHYFYSKRAQKKVDRLIARHMPKHVYCQLIRVTEYVVKYSIFEKTLDYMDTFSAGMSRRAGKSKGIKKRILEEEAKRLLEYEKGVKILFDNATIISEQDRELLDLPQKESIAIVRNGVDLDYFKNKGTAKDVDLVFTGNMSYPPNVEGAVFLVEKILPIVHQTYPNVNVLISGVSPAARVKALAGKQVTIGGWIDDIRDSYSRAKIFVAPLMIGTGLQNKLLEAMSMEVPCVTTSLVNNALGAGEEEILIGDSAEELAEHIVTILEDEGMKTRMAIAGRSFVSRNYTWEVNTKILRDLIDPNAPDR